MTVTITFNANVVEVGKDHVLYCSIAKVTPRGICSPLTTDRCKDQISLEYLSTALDSTESKARLCSILYT